MSLSEGRYVGAQTEYRRAHALAGLYSLMVNSSYKKKLQIKFDKGVAQKTIILYHEGTSHVGGSYLLSPQGAKVFITLLMFQPTNFEDIVFLMHKLLVSRTNLSLSFKFFLEDVSK